MYNLITHRLEKVMIPENRNFEEFIDFRDMIQGNALDDRMKMIQYMSKKPVMAMARGGSIENQEEDKRIAKVGDSLAEVYVEATLAKNPNMFDKFYKQQARMSEGADLVSGGLASMPMVNASFGGFLKNAAIGVGKSIVSDIAGEVVGGIAESFSPALADALGTTAGKAIFGAGTNALIDYGLNEVFDYGAKPDIYSFGTDVALRGFADYMATPEDERSVFGELFLDEKDADDARKIAAIRAARIKQAEARTGKSATKRREALQDFTGLGLKSQPAITPKKDFLSRVADYSRLDQAVKDPTSRVGGRQLALRGLEPLTRSILEAAAEEEQPQNQIPQVARPVPQVAKLSSQVGGLREIPIPANVKASDLNQRQLTELATKGFTIHKGKRITKQDLVGRSELVRRTKPVVAATGGLISLKAGGAMSMDERRINKARESYVNWLNSMGGPGALSRRALREGRIDEVMTPAGPEYFKFNTGESSQDAFGEGMYDDVETDPTMFPFAYPENKEQFIFRKRTSPTNVAQSIQKIAPSDSNREFVLRLLGLEEKDDDINLDLIEANRGGSLMTDQFSGMVGGDGHGMEDNVQMPIVSDGEQVATLAVSPKEYVVDAYTMAALGNGNADEGAKIMDETIKSIRRKAYGTNKQPNEINGSKALRSGLRSIA